MHNATMLHDDISGSRLVVVDGADHALIWTPDRAGVLPILLPRGHVSQAHRSLADLAVPELSDSGRPAVQPCLQGRQQQLPGEHGVRVAVAARPFERVPHVLHG